MAVLALGAAAMGAGGLVSAWGGSMLLSTGLTMLGGSLISSALRPRPPTQYGPRLGDLKVQTSTYGKAIPQVFGTMRLAGNMIWSTPLHETRHEQGGGGKGGGGGQTSVTYTYAQSFAVALCAGEIKGITKIWANGKLIYNNSGFSAGTQGMVQLTGMNTADLQKLAQQAPWFNPAVMIPKMRLYLGTASQPPDSVMQAYLGVANTPAYRGLAYIVFEELQLEAYGNRAPNLEFEVSMATGSAVMYSVWNGLAAAPILNRPALPTLIECGDTSGNLLWRVPLRVLNHPLIGDYPEEIRFGDRVNNMISGNGYVLALGFGMYQPYLNPPQSAFSLIKIVDGVITSRADVPELACMFHASWGKDYCIYTLPGWDMQLGEIVATSGLAISQMTKFANAIPYQIFETSDGNLGIVYVQALGVLSNAQLLQSGETLVIVTPSGTVVKAYSGLPAVTSWVDTGLGEFVGVNNGPFGGAFVRASIAVRLNRATGVLTSFDSRNQPVLPNINPGPMLGTLIGDTIFYCANGNEWSSFNLTTNLWASVTRAELLKNAPSSLGRLSGALLPASRMPINYGMSLINDMGYSFAAGVGNAPAVGDIVSSICQSAGLASADFDVSQLTEQVPGYMLSQICSGRAAIEPLMQAFYFDCVESDGKLKFVRRGGAVVATLTEDDLAAHAAGSAMPDALVIDRTQELDLPMEVTVSHADPDFNQLEGVQFARRMTTPSRQKTNLQLPMSITAAKARQVAETLLWDAWTARVALQFSTSNKFAMLEPTDVVTLVAGGRSYTVRIVSKDEGLGIHTFHAVLESTQVYAQPQVVQGVMPAPVNVVAYTGAPSNFQMMDIPLLRDQDDGIGFYTAAAGYVSGWMGTQPFKSNDGGASWAQWGRGLLNEAVMGTASTALGSFTGGNTFDEANVVTVVLTSGSLSSVSELAVLNGGNMALIGDELVQFKNAQLSAPGTYRLSGLLRGRQGTEASMASHVANERFVLLTATTTYIQQAASAEYNLPRKYRGVSIGGFLVDATDINFTHTGRAQKPYSPVQLGGGRTVSGDLTLTWTRRGRINNQWIDGVDVPVGEAAENYEVEIWTAGFAALKRTLTGLTAPTASYPAAQQIADFGAPQAAVNFKVYQLSATAGRGIPATATV